MILSRQMSKAVVFGILIGITGVIFYIIPSWNELEEHIGIALLFKLRGTRQAPPDVVIVSIDKSCADKLNLPNDPEKWPRSLHARLADNLKREGASVIAFDIFFKEARSADDDNLFASAISKAGNVVIVESIRRENIVLKDDEGVSAGNLNIEKLIPPISLFARSSAAVAPFPLPKIPVKVSQYWTFKTTAGDTPTLPVIAFQIFALDVYDEFIQLMETYSPSNIDRLPRTTGTKMNIGEVVRVLRDIFKSDPMIAKKMLEELNNTNTTSVDTKKKLLLRSLIKMYQSPDSQYLNFYGNPRTIRTIPYYEALKLNEKSSVNQARFDFKGKAVFIGASEASQPEQKDGFYTVFTESTGLDISGVEIAATAFANIIEDMPVKPLPFKLQLLTVLIFGILMGIFCRLFSVAIFTSIAAGTGIIYLTAVFYQFKTGGIWYPLVTPLFFQMPIAFLGGLACKYRDSNKERQHIKEAFKYYLPDNVVEELSKNIASVKSSTQIVYGTCLYTDAEGYTGLSEMMDPGELSSLMNRYYATVFNPVKKQGGIVSNVIGDAMLAVWVTAEDDNASRKKACLAALDIKKALNNSTHKDTQLQTRIGLHSGHISLGNIGAADHYEYRPVGDIVNTATRIEGLNKILGTGMLLSEEVLNGVNGLLTRRLGKFLLAGKSKPIIIHELVCLDEDSHQEQRDICKLFSKAYEELKKQSWEDAIRSFQGLIKEHGEDGPSLYYITLCNNFKNNPPQEMWDGINRINKK